MKESAQAAMSYVRSKAKELGVSIKDYSKYDYHIHVPAGAIPKDGPSAGVTMAISLISLFKGESTKAYVAMTGEITLRGIVLPVGGIKEKVLAAKRAGITTVILPKRNEKDLVEVPEKAKENMTFKFVEKVSEILPLIFVTKKQAKEIKKQELSSVH
jgi:ATP-dependent Lon protease